MDERAGAPDPAELLARFRRSYRNYRQLWTAPGHAPEGVTLATPEERPLKIGELPEGIRRLLDAESRKRLTLVKHLRVVDGEPDLLVEDGSDLPPDEELVTLSQTVTLNSAEQVRIVTDIFVARRG